MRFDTADVAAGEREAYVQDVVCNGVVPLEIEHRGHMSQGIELQLSSADLGPVSVQSLRSSAMAFKRTARLVRSESAPHVVLAVQRGGSGTMIQDGREAVFGAGDLTLVSTTQPSVIVSGHHSPAHLVRIPTKLLAVPEAAVRRAVALRVGPEIPIAGVVSRFVNDLATLPDLRPVEAEHLARPTVELVRALIATVVGDSRRARESMETTLQVQVIDYLRAHWHERDMDAGRIAAAHHISTRHVYRLLAAEGVSLGDWLRDQRLKACRDELATKGAATVAAVGRQWGFLDATNFGRAFKAAYGLTPLEWRLLHQKARGEGRSQ